MKIKPEHYNYMKVAMHGVKEKIPIYIDGMKKTYVGKNFDKRIRWDILHHTVTSRWIVDNIYPYADDTHIDTALRSIMREL